jgi:hypothetical protein
MPWRGSERCPSCALETAQEPAGRPASFPSLHERPKSSRAGCAASDRIPGHVGLLQAVSGGAGLRARQTPGCAGARGVCPSHHLRGDANRLCPGGAEEAPDRRPVLRAKRAFRGGRSCNEVDDGDSAVPRHCPFSPSVSRSSRTMSGSSGGLIRGPSRSICAISASTASRPSASRTAWRGVRLPSSGIFSSTQAR